MKYIKYILGLDIGSNSIGWALIQLDLLQKTKRIIATGSRIIPMDQKVLSDFGKGITISPTAQRTSYRNARHCRERHLLRRERLHRGLHILGFLPTHYDKQIDFSKRYGKFVDNTEPKIAYNEGKFLFMDSFQEMLSDFKSHQPDLFYTKKNGEESKIPYDWTIYYLRKKALSQKISKEELAWIILNFNQKRGYYQLREEEGNKENDFEIISSKIISVIKKDKDKKYNKYWYDIILENGLVYQAAFYNDFVYNWINQDREFIIERTSLKNGAEKVKLSYLPTFDEIDKMDKKEQDKYYKKIKIKTENSIGNKTVGCYIYDHILQNPNEKIKGKLVRTIERKYYKEELKAILEKQIALQPELFTDQLLADCIRELYSKNEAQQRNLAARDFVHLFVEDIIFYQRPLRRQKSTIANCSL